MSRLPSAFPASILSRRLGPAIADGSRSAHALSYILDLMDIARFCLLVLALSAAACTRDDQPREEPVRTAALRVHTTQRSSFQTVAGDTLSDSARVLAIYPEQDGDALVALFSDPGRMARGLAIVDRKMAAPELLWPDSVTNVWWTGPHTLAFTTTSGTGIRLVVDVHAEKLNVADTTHAGMTPPVMAAGSDSAMMHRARAYTDSVRSQVGGTPQGSALTYAVSRLVPSADGRLAAFHTTARDAQGALMNPAWYALDRESGAVVLIDQVTGPVAELPESAGQWSEGGSFFYAKGSALWEAEVARTGATAP